MIPASEWAKTVHALDRAATVIGIWMTLEINNMGYKQVISIDNALELYSGGVRVDK
jgi:hypothetical protein